MTDDSALAEGPLEDRPKKDIESSRGATRSQAGGCRVALASEYRSRSRADPERLSPLVGRAFPRPTVALVAFRLLLYLPL